MASRKREAKGLLLVAIVVMVLALYVLAGNVFIVREIVWKATRIFPTRM